MHTPFRSIRTRDPSIAHRARIMHIRAFVALADSALEHDRDDTATSACSAMLRDLVSAEIASVDPTGDTTARIMNLSGVTARAGACDFGLLINWTNAARGKIAELDKLITKEVAA